MKKIRHLTMPVIAGFIMMTVCIWCAQERIAHALPGVDLNFLSNDLNSPGLDVWWVKCTKATLISAVVYDTAQVRDNAFHVSIVCLAPAAQKGKGELEYTDGDHGRHWSHQATVDNCREAFIMVQCELNDTCDHLYAFSDLFCQNADFVNGFPKKTQ